MRDEGFREFVTSCAPALSRTAYLLTGDHHLAEDLLQSALANCHRHWRRIRHDNPAGYVRRAMHREHISWWRRRRPPERLLGEPDPGHAAPGDLAEQAALRLTMTGALAVLTARQRAVVVLRFYDDLTEAETARVLGCTVGTVKRHGHDALARLRAHLPGAFAEHTEVPS
ncbi:SigE family RNA polymerase sigma factor [Longispora urticae]